MAIFHLFFILSFLCIGGLAKDAEIKDCPSSMDGDIKVYEDKCYYFHLTERKTFNQASDICKKHGQRLLKPISEDASGYLWFVILYMKKGDRVWLDVLQDNFAEGGSKYYFSESGTEIPSKAVRDMKRYGVPLVVPRANGVWHFDMIDKDETHPFVCELHVEEKTTTISPPTPSAPTAPSTESTKFNSLVEKLCPNLPDSQKYMKLFGHDCFYFQMKNLVNHSHAEKICQKYNGKLAILNTETRDHFVQYHMKFTFKQTMAMWIGLAPIGTGFSPGYRWLDGTPFTYTNVNIHSAVNENTDSAVIYYGYNCQWYNVEVRKDYGYICQFPAKSP